jgi:cobalt-zinc-cadmium efflux system outer membrane protein
MRQTPGTGPVPAYPRVRFFAGIPLNPERLPFLRPERNFVRIFRVMSVRCSVSCVVLALVLAGCASTDPQQAFAPVQSEVGNLSGQRVVWNQDVDADHLVNDAASQRLRSPLDADAAAQIALINNPDLQATFEDLGISQADLVQAGLLKNPVFFASLRFPDVAPGITDAEYSVAEDFLSVALVPLQMKIARQNLAATQARLAHEVIELIAQVKSAFYTYQADLQLGERLKLILQADQAGADLAQKQQQAGNLNKLGFLNQQAQVASAQMALAEAQKATIATREKLNLLMGLWGAAITWTARPELPSLPESDPGTAPLEKLALRQRSDLRALREETDAIGQALALKTGIRFLPVNIDIGADTEETPDRQRVTGPTLQIDVPIFDQGQGAIGKLTAQHRQMQWRLRALSIQIMSETRESARMLIIDRNEVALFKKTVVPLNIQTVNQSLLQYNAMEVNTYDLFLAKQRELDAERDYIGAWRDYWITRTELEAAVGGSLRAAPQP